VSHVFKIPWSVHVKTRFLAAHVDHSLLGVVVGNPSLFPLHGAIKRYVHTPSHCHHLPYEFLILQYKLVFVGKISELLVILR
jgi:hypothetical protein